MASLPRTALPNPFTMTTTTTTFSPLRASSASSSIVFNYFPTCSRMKISISSSSELLPVPENRIVVGCGLAVMDLLAAVASYPKPDEKIRSISFKVQGGGNAGNAFTCAARLGLNPRIITKVANDSQGKAILDELEADGVDASFVVVSEGGNSPFSYVIVDNQTQTRTCIITLDDPPMRPEDLSKSNLSSALNGARLVYFDERLLETALFIAHEARRRGIPIVVDAETKKEGLDNLLKLSDYVVCSSAFPQAFTNAPSIPSALVSLLLRFPDVKFAIVTLAEDGCIMLERTSSDNKPYEEMDVNNLLESLKQKRDSNATGPICISSSIYGLRAEGIGTVTGRLLVGTAEKIPPSELVDTTGAGDAFIGAVLYAICTNMPPERMLPFACQVAAVGCRALGARTGLPYRTDPRLAPYIKAE